jgi:hypothetical protein
MIAVWASAAGLAIGAGMGLAGLLNPKWAANLVRLRDNPDRPGGFAEFRGTYGGLFLASHAVALAWVLPSASTGVVGEMALGAVMVCGAMWIGTAVARLLSIVLDKTGGAFNYASVAFEIALGLAIVAPWMVQGE